jgi:hypothetical protein
LNKKAFEFRIRGGRRLGGAVSALFDLENVACRRRFKGEGLIRYREGIAGAADPQGKWELSGRSSEGKEAIL